MADDWSAFGPEPAASPPPVNARVDDAWEAFEPERRTVETPKYVPRAFVDRFTDDADTFDNLNKTVGDTVAGRIAAALFEGANAGFGHESLGISPADTKKLQELGIFRDPDAELNAVSGLRFMNEAVIRPAYSAVAATFRGINAAVYAAGATGGQILAEVSGANESEAARARRDGAHFATVATLLAGGHPVSRMTRGPQGEIISQPVGRIPTREDFANAAHVVGGDEVPFSVQEKLLRSYEESGLHPAEVGIDATHDPVVAQRLLSSDPEVVPGGRDAPLYQPAVRIDGKIYTGGNHSDALDRAAGATKIPFDELVERAGGEQGVWDNLDGFVNRDGGFITMAEAYRLADKAEGKGEFEGAGNGGGQGGPPPEPPAIAEPPSNPPRSFAEAEKRILDKISVGETAAQERWSWGKFYRQAVDNLYPLKAVDADAYQLARLSRGMSGKAEHFLEHGTFDFNTYANNGKPLAQIIEPVSENLNGLRAYLTSKRAMEIEASGRKTGVDLNAANVVVSEGAGKYEKIAGEIATYQENLLKYLRDSGVVSEKSFAAMREANQNYIPFYRVITPNTGGAGGAGKSFNVSNPLKRLRGSERDVIDPLESIIKNTYAYISAAERNAVAIKLVDALKKDGAVVKTSPVETDPALAAHLKESGVSDPEALIEFIKHAVPEGGDTLSAFQNGKRQTVKVNDPELVKAFRGLDENASNMILRAAALPAKTLRAGATLSPDFITRNIVHDFFSAFVNTGGAVFSPIDTARGLIGTIRKDADFQNWLKGGGANSTMVGLDRRYMQESLSKLTGETGLGNRAWNVVTSPIRYLRMASELAEQATRLGEFKKLAGDGGKQAIQDAAMSSREVTLDFARIGASVRAYNMITAFGNAHIQGLDRIGRAFVDHPFNTTAKIAGGITLPSVLLWFANHEDPRYQELPDWQRDMFWIVMTKEHIYRIPKPHELGVVFGTGAERILDATIGKNPEAFDGFRKSMMKTFELNMIPTIAQPIVEQFANRSTFTDRTLIPAPMEKQLPEYQFTPYTTETAKALGKMVSAFPGMRAEAIGPGAPFGGIARTMQSPILLENYVRAWTGGLGAYALQAADLGLRKAGIVPDPVKPTATLADVPFVKAFVVRYPSATTQSIQDFSDQYDVAKRFFTTWTARAKDGDVEAMQRVQEAGGADMFLKLDGIKNTLTNHTKLINDITKNPGIKADEKRQLIDGLYFAMIQLGQAGKKMMREGRKSLAPVP